ncbi:uncharacterized protein LOC111313008 [Durio zibethinus]|uniref:Uncharacterized protein LOC111313008 n=1 Tax=Durio zibethinus TaxID=66656 RepID=A0A6P6AXA5_DURZI|nr:uncharacterized protein LOC111313008 [Durio zibethinus]
MLDSDATGLRPISSFEPKIIHLLSVDKFSLTRKLVTEQMEARRSMETNDVDVEYVRLIEEDSSGAGFGLRLQEETVPQSPSNGKSWTWLLKLIVICISLVVVPAIKWEEQAFNSFEQVIVIFASLALFPVVCLPSTPSIWVAGMTFGYGKEFLLVVAGVSVGVSLPYFAGSIFHGKIQGLSEKYPQHASILRLAGEGKWIHQFQAVTSIRISPLPYIILNHAVVATNVDYSPYLFGTLVGMVPEVFVALYRLDHHQFHILIRSFEEATQDKRTPTRELLVFNVVGFCASMIAILSAFTQRGDVIGKFRPCGEAEVGRMNGNGNTFDRD